jgi:flagellar hook assembly protein FlgD
MKNQYTSKNLAMGFLLAFATIFMVDSVLLAQQTLPNRRIVVDETWDTDQVLTTSIIVQSGATLTITGGAILADVLSVGFEYVDINGDGFGDLQIIIEAGGTLVSTGFVNLQASGSSPYSIANPTLTNNRHWDGIVLQSENINLSANTTILNAVNPYTLEVAGTFTGLSVDGTFNGITVSEDNTIIAGGTIANIGGVGLVINANNVGVYSYDMTNVDTALTVNGDNVIIKYVNADTISGAGFVIRGSGTTMDWLEAKNGGTGLVVASTGLNTTITNSDFDANVVGMTVDSAATVTIDNTFFRNATANGVEVAGTASFDNSSVISSGGIGIDIASGANVTFVNSTDSGHVSFGVQIADSAIVLFNRANISENDDAGDQIQLASNLNTGIQANMQNNWWGVGTRVDTMFTQVNLGTVDYTDFRVASAFFFNGADLAITPAITFSNLATDPVAANADNTFSIGDQYTLSYTTTGNVRYIRLNDIAASSTLFNAFGTTTDVNTLDYPNIGSIPVQFDAVANGGEPIDARTSTNGTSFAVFAPAVQANVITTADAINIISDGATDLGTAVDIDDAWLGGSTVTVRWSVPNSVTLVDISYADGNGNSVTVAENVTASLGTFNITVPANTLNGDGIVGVGNGQITLTIADAAEVATAATSVLDGILTVPNSNWAFTATDANMTVHFEDVDFLAAAVAGGASLVVPNANEKIYVGAFYTDDNGDLKNAGYSLLDPTTASNFSDETNLTADGGGVSEPITLTIYGDDLNTPAKDGYATGDNLQFYMYRESWTVGANENTQTDQLDAFTRRVDAYDLDASDGDPIVVLTYATNFLADGSGIDAATTDPAQLIFADDAYQGAVSAFATQVSDFFFDTFNFNDETAARRTATAGWFYISSFLDHDGTNANDLAYITGADNGDVLDDVDAGAEGESRPNTVTDGAYEFDDDRAFGTPVAADLVAAEAGWFHWDDDAGAYVATPAPSPTALGIDAFTMLKNGRGDVYWNIAGAADFTAGISSGAFLTSPTWDNLQGYLIRIEVPADAADLTYLRFVGDKLTPETSPIALATGWNLVPNLRGGENGVTFAAVDQLNINLGMASIADPNIIVKDQYGDIYWPAFGINTIGLMRENQAYYTYVSTPDVLTYPADSFTPKTRVDADKAKLPITHYKVGFNSDNSAIVMIDGANLSNLNTGAEVGFFSPRGDLVGSAVYSGGNIAATLWGESSLKEEGEKGLKAGEQFTVKTFDPSNGEELRLANMTFAKGSNVYEPNGISIVADGQLTEELLPSSFALEQNYPNPFNPSTTINFSMPEASRVTVKVYNVMGQLVSTLVNREMNAGRHSVNFDASRLASGVYLYRIQAGSFTATRKMNLIK